MHKNTTFPEGGGGGKCPLLPMPAGAHGKDLVLLCRCNGRVTSESAR